VPVWGRGCGCEWVSFVCKLQEQFPGMVWACVWVFRKRAGASPLLYICCIPIKRRNMDVQSTSDETWLCIHLQAHTRAPLHPLTCACVRSVHVYTHILVFQLNNHTQTRSYRHSHVHVYACIHGFQSNELSHSHAHVYVCTHPYLPGNAGQERQGCGGRWERRRQGGGERVGWDRETEYGQDAHDGP